MGGSNYYNNNKQGSQQHMQTLSHNKIGEEGRGDEGAGGNIEMLFMDSQRLVSAPTAYRAQKMNLLRDGGTAIFSETAAKEQQHNTLNNTI